MSEGKVTLERRGHVLLIGLDRAEKYNAFDLSLYHELAKAYGELERDDELRCAVLFAHGEHFTAGLDLAQWVSEFGQGKWPALPDGALDPMMLQGEPRTKPVVMAIQGICFTIGIELLLACDIRVAANNTRFAQIEIKRGIYPVGGATMRWHMESGWGNAMRYLLTGDEFDAHEAYRMNMVQAVTEPGEELHKAIEIAETIAKQAPLGVYATLKSARLTRYAAEQAAIETLLPDLLPLMASEDVQEGIQSFLERREANFNGR
jgi:enoyl-CoA hydratase